TSLALDSLGLIRTFTNLGVGFWNVENIKLTTVLSIIRLACIIYNTKSIGFANTLGIELFKFFERHIPTHICIINHPKVSIILLKYNNHIGIISYCLFWN